MFDLRSVNCPLRHACLAVMRGMNTVLHQLPHIGSNCTRIRQPNRRIFADGKDILLTRDAVAVSS